MRVACILHAQEISNETADLVVFPEGVCQSEINEAMRVIPNALIVGAVLDGNHSRGVLLHRGQNKIDYLKVATDGRTKGSGNHNQTPIYEADNICIGVLVCMDVDQNNFSRPVIEKIKASGAKSKYLCVPADMGNHWFNHYSLPFPSEFEGINFILCNHIKTHQARCKSFITDQSGKKIVIQNDKEPIYANLP